MTILKQGPIYKYMGKGKWTDAWYIFLVDEKGPQIALFRDSSAKKPLEAPIEVKTITEKLRFGYTTRQFADRIEITKKDIRIDESAFIAFMTEKLIKKVTKTETVWLCASSITDMFDMIKLISRCLTLADMKAPEANDLEEMDSLHRYNPLSFQPENEWEKYYDSPPRQMLIVPLAAGILRSASADELTEKKTMKAIKNKNLKKRKEETQSMTALNEISSETRRSTVSMGSDFSKQSTKTVPSIFILQDGLAPMQTLYRTHEACERPPLAPKPSFYQSSQKSTPSASEATSLVSPSPVPSERKSVRTEVLVQLSPMPNGRTCDVQVQTDESRVSRPKSAVVAPEPIPLASEPVVVTPEPVSKVILPVGQANSMAKKEDFDQTVLKRDPEYNEVTKDEVQQQKVEDKFGGNAVAPLPPQRASLGSDSMGSSIDDFEDAFSRTQSLIQEPRRKCSDLDGDLPSRCAYYNEETKMYTVEITP